MKNSLNHNYLLCQDWKREITFFKDEINVFKSRLDEVASKNTGHDVMVKVEHFENKFKLMSNHFDELMHDVNLKTDEINAQSAAQPKYINVKMNDMDSNLQEMIEFTSNDFYATKKDFYKFLASVL
jgi:hypothetical protein